MACTNPDRALSLRPLIPVGNTANDVLSALDKALPWLVAHSDARALLRTALRDPSRVNAVGVASLVDLAKAVGTQAHVAAAEAELESWQRGERLAW